VREKQAVETKRQAEVLALEKQQRLAEKRKAEEVQQAAERARVEKEQLAAKQRAIEDRKRRETEARAEAERQRMLAAAEREDLERREAEMAQTMQAEESLLVASQSGEMNRYIARIQYQVESNWVKPASAQSGLSCEVAVKQLPSGDVVDVRTVRCNGDDMVRRSIEDAVHRSSPLPLPENNLLFDRNLSFTFQPE
jgi:colicin import membrane protein